MPIFCYLNGMSGKMAMKPNSGFFTKVNFTKTLALNLNKMPDWKLQTEPEPACIRCPGSPRRRWWWCCAASPGWSRSRSRAGFCRTSARPCRSWKHWTCYCARLNLGVLLCNINLHSNKALPRTSLKCSLKNFQLKDGSEHYGGLPGCSLPTELLWPRFLLDQSS